MPDAYYGSDDRPAEPTDLGVFSGVVKSFCHINGYGFISCGELRAAGHEKDPFLHRSQIRCFSPVSVGFSFGFSSDSLLQPSFGGLLFWARLRFVLSRGFLVGC